MGSRSHALVALVCALLATAGLAAPGGDATRAELRAWFGELRTSGVRVDGALPWQYGFAAADSQRLEALSVALVASGYRIASLAAGAAGGSELRVVKSELHTPTSLERRNVELVALARERGARYLGASPAP